MFGKFQRSLTGLLALLAVGAQGNDRYLQVVGPVPLRFQAPTRPPPPPLPLPPSTPVEQPPMPGEEAPVPPEPPVTSVSPGVSPTSPETLEPLGPPVPPLATPSSVSAVPDPLTSATSSPKTIGSTLGPLTPDNETVTPQALMGFFRPQRQGPRRSGGAAVVVDPAVFTPAQPAATQPSSATYTVK